MRDGFPWRAWRLGGSILARAGGPPLPLGAASRRPPRTRFGAPFSAHVPVGGFPAGTTSLGVLDLAGNVWQRVSSVYRPYPHGTDDGREELEHVSMARGTRGGCHDCAAEELRATERGRRAPRRPAAGPHDIGFRCARTAAP